MSGCSPATAIALLALAPFVSACGSSSPGPSHSAATQTHAARREPRSPGPCGTAAAPPKAYKHVVWVVMENHSYTDIIGAPDAPFENQLAARCGSSSRSFGVTHPSLPNYIAMTSGSPQGVSDDRGPADHPLGAPSIFSQTNGDWRALEESMPSNCLLDNAGRYAPRHNPATYYTSVKTECGTRDVPLGSVPDVSASFTFVTPNLCSDTHDCDVKTGDAWLSAFLPKLFSSAEYRAGNTALFLTWDEDDRKLKNQIPTLVMAPSVRPGTASTTRFDHYSMLRTTEELLGLHPFLGNAAKAPSMRSAFNL
jgi:hypothetical protein